MIDNGAESLKKLRKQDHSRAAQRMAQQPYNRLHVLLTTLPGYDRGEVMKLCQTLEQMSPAEREETIRQNFGEQVLGRCRPALDQLSKSGL